MQEGQTVESTPVAVAEPASQPATGQAASQVSGTPEGQNGSAATQAQSASAEDNFSNVDPTTLPPELQKVYKNLQADYTRKTQSIADARKKAEAYDYLSKDQRFVEYWNGLNKQQKAEFKEQKTETEKRLGEKITNERFAKAFESKDDFLALLEEVVQDRSAKSQKKIEALEKQLSVKEAADVIESFAREADPKTGQQVRPDFYKLDEDQLITGFLTINQPEGGTPQAYVSKLNEAYSWAKSVTQKYYEKGKAETLARMQQKAATSTEMPTNATKSTVSAKDAKNWSVSEAIARAKKGERVPQVYD